MIIILLLLLVTALEQQCVFAYLPYRWKLMGSGTDWCNNQTCNRQPHSVCNPVVPQRNCRKFQMLPMDQKRIDYIVNGHNGLRNRIAKDTKRPASNMNLLYWDESLQRMAEGYIVKCFLMPDPCDFIYDHNLTVGRNFLFTQGPPARRWEIKAIRKWFVQGNDLDPSNIDSYNTTKSFSYTQMIWGNAEFIGCAAAEMQNGYALHCNYEPKGNIKGQQIYSVGPACTNCSESRPVCSLFFTGLCGIDIKSAANTIFLNGLIAAVWLLFVAIYGFRL